LGEVFGRLRVSVVPILHDCSDGFLGRFGGDLRPYLGKWVRAGISSFGRLNRQETTEAMERLRRDLESGEWERRNGHLHRLEEIDFDYRLVVAEPT